MTDHEHRDRWAAEHGAPPWRWSGEHRPNYWQPVPLPTIAEAQQQVARARRQAIVARVRSHPLAVVLAVAFAVGFVFTYPLFCFVVLLVGGPIAYGVHRWRRARAEVDRLLRQVDIENTQFIVNSDAYIRRIEGNLDR